MTRSRILVLLTCTILLSSSATAQEILYRGTPHTTSASETGPTPDLPSGPLAITSPGDVALSATEEWNLRFGASGGTAPYGFVAIGAPSGITASADGVLTGLAEPDVYAGIRMRVTDAAGGDVLSQPITVTVGGPGVLVAMPASLTGLDVIAPRLRGTSQTVTFRNSGDRPVALPAMTVTGQFEIAADESDSNTCGATLRRVETCQVKVRAIAPANGQAGPISGTLGGSAQLAGTVIVPTLTIATATLANAVVGTTYSYDFSPRLTRDGVPAGDPIAWSTPSTLPSGLTLEPATGVLSGTPTAATTEAGASFEVVATHTDASGRQTFTLKVEDGLLIGVTQIVAGNAHTCALLSGGAVNCWGNNGDGQLGTGDKVQKNAPGTTTAIASGATQITAGTHHVCALLSGGAVDCWGHNGSGQLGTGSTTAKLAPGESRAIASGATQVAAGSNYTCALLSGGAVNCWGSNGSGHLGTGNTTNKLAPGGSRTIASGATQIAAGANHTCALLSGGAVNCWGNNASGQLGTGDTTNKLAPGTTTAIASGATQITAGNAFTCALLSGGAVDCWGNGGAGRLGNGNATTNKLAPGTPRTIASGATQVVAGSGGQACALLSGGAVNCWGHNGTGQLGTGNTTQKNTPGTTTAIASGATQITAGGFHTCAVLSDGTANCWGHNGTGQLGTGDTTNKSSPGNTPVVR